MPSALYAGEPEVVVPRPRVRGWYLTAAGILGALLIAWGAPRAWQAWQERRWADASLYELEEAIRRHPRDVRARLYLGTALRRSGQTREAMQVYREAMRLAPSDPDARFGLAALSFQIGADTEARELLLPLVTRYPRYAEAYRLLGMIHQGRGLYRQAGEFYARLADLKPQDADAWAGIGLCASENEQPTVTLRAFRRAVALSPGQAIYLRGLGRAEAQFGELTAAITHLRQAVALEPNNAMGQYELGRVLAGRADSQPEAEACLRRAIALGNLTEARFELALLLEAADRYTAAAPELESVLRREPLHYPARNALARVYARLGRREASRAQWTRFRRVVTLDRLRSNLRHRLALAPDDPDLHLRLARVLAETDDRDGARHEYETVLRLRPSHAAARRELSRLLGPRE